MKFKDLQALKAQAVDAAHDSIDAGDMDKYKEHKAEIDKINAQIEAYSEIQEAEKVNQVLDFNQMPKDPVIQDKQTEVKSFVNFMRTGLISDAMVEKVDEDGGLLVPEDISFKINEYKREYVSLEDYVNVEPVSRPKGSRLYEKLSTMTPLVAVEEMTEIPEIEGPGFERINFMVKNYAGILPMSNDLIQDSDENVVAYAARWGARKSVVTRNSLILSLIKQLPVQAINSVDGIKTAINVTLDPVFHGGAVIITNQDGFNVLDLLKYEDGKYVMQPNPIDPTKKQIEGKDVIMFSNKVLPSNAGKAPIIIGDLKEAITLFDRQQQSILTTNIGGKAFTRNSTDMRFIEREDVKFVDKEAVVYAEIDKNFTVAAPDVV
ncbi:phage major capsid protein [Macrococcus equipercicus]|uniref:Phage major capsid protein n=1 Tax=Macrococcus equipercicus TaxID=69967 RepID=A0A9Q9F101_9STAP|nr:phage major capsid protein [Macrococcus equipercicus]UTH13300.1 phage major capsid protein [Macrococcus equipercicus]